MGSLEIQDTNNSLPFAKVAFQSRTTIQISRNAYEERRLELCKPCCVEKKWYKADIPVANSIEKNICKIFKYLSFKTKGRT